MKRLIITAAALLLFISTGVLYSSKMSQYQLVEIYVCEQEIVLAEMLAKRSINRQVLTTVSYCTCEGVDPSLKKQVKNSKCEPPKDMVYDCTCVGKTHY
jgi:hypothetical protein